MRRLVLAMLLTGCVDAPTVNRPAPEPTLWPGYCTAENEQDGLDGADGRRVAHYDPAGRLVADTFDSDLDGDADVDTAYTYDADDRLVRLEIDRYTDGVIDEIRTYEWADNRMMRETWDQDADGEVDVDIAYEHDDRDRRVRGYGQTDDDEDIEIVFRFEWEGDTLGALYIDGFNRPADGKFDRVIFYTYDEVGNLVQAFLDFDGNGVVDMVVTYAYDCWM